MKYTATITVEVEIEAENVAKAWDIAQRMRLIPGVAHSEKWPVSLPYAMGCGSSRVRNNREYIRYYSNVVKVTKVIKRIDNG